MAHRLQMKLGVVPEADRLPDSPDTVLHVEPTVGSQARSKGHLYLLVTSQAGGLKAREATRLVADAIRSEYYYDESAGIRVCLIKSIQAANKRLAHARERSILGSADPGPIGVAVAVVRDNELYVGTVGPAEAYLSRGARLSTLPDPHRDRGLPSADLEPDVWRGEMNVGDQLVLASPNLLASLGPDDLKDALVTLHPQSAMDHLHARFVTNGGSGSDGAIEIEAAEVQASRVGRAPVPVRPPEPLAGVPDKSPIPLADSVAGGVSAAQDGARRARDAAGGVAGRLFAEALDRLPSRRPASRTVSSAPARRETERRAALAILAFVIVVGALGLGVFLLGGKSPTGQVISSFAAGQDALTAARNDLSQVSGPGVDLVDNDPTKAERLLKDALTQLATAKAAGIAAVTLDPLRAQAVAGLNALYKMADVTDDPIFTFPGSTPVDLKAIVQGPDGAPYVIDGASSTVYRIDTAHNKATAIFKKGTIVKGVTEGDPRLLALGGRDLVIVDSKNNVWKWRPANLTGRGTMNHVNVSGSASWGSDVSAIGTFIRNPDLNLYNLYVIVPSAQTILRYSPAADGSGSYPVRGDHWLATDRPVNDITSMYIDGDIFVTEAGQLMRLVNGNSEGWSATAPPDSVLRSAPSYTLVTSGAPRRAGTLYAFDGPNLRVIALTKASGSYIGEFELADGSEAWSDLRGWYVEPGVSDAPDAIVWISGTEIHRTILATSTSATGSPAPSGGTSPAPSGSTGVTSPAPSH
ncbi:MAG TPA: hypothetical protein VKR30_10330 [Candidatus Limnocylindrales bacterium]|nr:hypothetical protein [Candidatus Limnocylindrales bacterium]